MKRCTLAFAFTFALGLAGLAPALPARAVELSGNVTLITDYVYRGISQTSENPAIQGGFDLEGSQGWYVGAWASNVDFDGSIEIDLYAGYKHSLEGEEGAFDIGVIAYEYPDDAQCADKADRSTCAPQSSFQEAYASIGYKGATLGVNYTEEFFFETGTATYLYLDYELALPGDVTLSLHYGDQAIEDNDAFGALDYRDYSVALGKSFGGIDFSLAWHDTDLSTKECFPDDTGAGLPTCGPRLVFGLSRSL